MQVFNATIGSTSVSAARPVPLGRESFLAESFPVGRVATAATTAATPSPTAAREIVAVESLAPRISFTTSFTERQPLIVEGTSVDCPSGCRGAKINPAPSILPVLNGGARRLRTRCPPRALPVATFIPVAPFVLAGTPLRGRTAAGSWLTPSRSGWLSIAIVFPANPSFRTKIVPGIEVTAAPRDWIIITAGALGADAISTSILGATLAAPAATPAASAAAPTATTGLLGTSLAGDAGSLSTSVPIARGHARRVVPMPAVVSAVVRATFQRNPLGGGRPPLAGWLVAEINATLFRSPCGIIAAPLITGRFAANPRFTAAAVVTASPPVAAAAGVVPAPLVLPCLATAGGIVSVRGVADGVVTAGRGALAPPVSPRSLRGGTKIEVEFRLSAISRTLLGALRRRSRWNGRRRPGRGTGSRWRGSIGLQAQSRHDVPPVGRGEGRGRRGRFPRLRPAGRRCGRAGGLSRLRRRSGAKVVGERSPRIV